MAQAPRNKLCLAAFCRQNALQAKKRDIFPAGKVWFLTPRPRRYFRAAEIRYLTRFRGKYFFLPATKFQALGELGR